MTPSRANRRTISVVIPCYNAEHFVAETIESVQKQLADLKAQGVLSEAEFEVEKAKILGY